MVSGSGSSTTRNASTGGHLALDGRGTVLVVRAALGALMPKRNGYEYPYDLATGGGDLHSALNRIARKRSPYMQNANCRHAAMARRSQRPPGDPRARSILSFRIILSLLIEK